MALCMYTIATSVIPSVYNVAYNFWSLLLLKFLTCIKLRRSPTWPVAAMQEDRCVWVQPKAGQVKLGQRSEIRASEEAFKISPEAEFMNVRFRRGFRQFTLQSGFKPLLLKGGGGRGSIIRSRGDGEKQGGKLLRLLS
jgi:hypothetical protein